MSGQLSRSSVGEYQADERAWFPRKQREDRRVAGLGLLWPRGSGPILRRGQASGSEPGERASGQRRASEGAGL